MIRIESVCGNERSTDAVRTYGSFSTARAIALASTWRRLFRPIAPTAACRTSALTSEPPPETETPDTANALEFASTQ